MDPSCCYFQPTSEQRRPPPDCPRWSSPLLQGPLWSPPWVLHRTPSPQPPCYFHILAPNLHFFPGTCMLHPHSCVSKHQTTKQAVTWHLHACPGAGVLLPLPVSHPHLVILGPGGSLACPKPGPHPCLYSPCPGCLPFVHKCLPRLPAPTSNCHSPVIWLSLLPAWHHKEKAKTRWINASAKAVVTGK